MIRKARQNGITVLPLPVDHLYALKTFGQWIRLVGWIRKYQIDVVQTYHFMSDVLGVLAARVVPGTIVLSNRRDKGFSESRPHFKYIRRAISRLSDMTICVSKDLRDQIIRQERVLANRSVVVYNGITLPIPANKSDQRFLAQRLAIDPDLPIIGTLSNIRPIKGLMYLVESAAIVNRENPNAQFIIVGGYADKTESVQQHQADLFARIHELKLDHRFVFTGPRNDIPALLQLFDLFVLPSLSEGFSNALIEAMMAECTIIATQVGGNPEAVENGVSGLIVPPAEPQALAHGILDCLNRPDWSRSLAKAARTRALKYFTTRAMVQSYQSLYGDILNPTP